MVHWLVCWLVHYLALVWTHSSCSVAYAYAYAVACAY